MRWPFGRKAGTSQGAPARATPDDAAITFVVARDDWRALPHAPVAIDASAPTTVGDFAPTIAAAARTTVPPHAGHALDVTPPDAGVVDGLVRLRVGQPARVASAPEPPLREGSALPSVAGRGVRIVAAPAPMPSALTHAERIAVALPPGPAPGPAAPFVVAADEPDEAVARERGGRRSLAQSRRLGLGPGYHGTLPDAVRRERLDAAELGEHDPVAYTEAVPNDLRTVLRDAYGVDIGDTPVHRGPAVSDEASSLGALAFARDGEVFVPIEAGPLDEPSAKGLLAHELAHAMQQRRRTAPLPGEGTREGLALEAEAQQAERFARGDHGASAPRPIDASIEADTTAADVVETQAFVADLVRRGVAEPDGTGGVRFVWTGGAAARAQRATQPAPAHPGAAAQQENWSFGAQLAHSFRETFVSDIEEGIAGEFGFSDDLQKELQTARDREDREYRREQTRNAFSELRLEHLRVQRRREASNVISDDDDRVLVNEVEQDLKDRIEQLNTRVKERLDEINRQLPQGEHPHDELDPDRVDKIFDRLFADPEAPIPADDHADSDAAGQAAKGAKAGAGPGAGAGGTAPSGAAPNAAPGATSMSGVGSGGSGVGAGRSGTTSAGGGTAGEGGIRSFADLRGALATDFGSLAASEAGITLTSAEMRELWSGSPQGAAGTSGAGAAQGASSQAGGAPATAGGPAATHPATDAHVGPGGHDMIDLDRLDLEDLTRRLYERLRTTLRQELIVDRERAGYLSDVR